MIVPWGENPTLVLGWLGHGSRGIGADDAAPDGIDGEIVEGHGLDET